jgi:FtsZ-binding cell division protein ZapB
MGFYLPSTFFTLLMTRRLLAIATITLASFTTQSWGQNQLEDTRKVFQELVNSRQSIADEQALWRVGKQSLLDTIDLLNLEIELLETRIEATEAQSTQAERDRIRLNGEIEELKDASAVIATVIRSLEERILKLVNAFPLDLKGKLDSLIGRIPDRNTPEGRIRASLGERMLNIVSLLDQLEVFNGAIHVMSEGRKENGIDITVQVVYIGLAHAFYVNEEQGVAGIGSVNTESGWTWTKDDSLVESVSKAIKVFQNDIPAEFVVLPVGN